MILESAGKVKKAAGNIWSVFEETLPVSTYFRRKFHRKRCEEKGIIR